ncbi:hypothetical protein [Bacillus paranthracis]|uniref:hypothetical protein n=1 Tax=Bacillus paranthracis TaxID=2026186 RepID=UPI001879DAC5|nr:hypothetical protein [Bacillus paranthracis]
MDKQIQTQNEAEDVPVYEDGVSVGWDDKLAKELEDSIKGFESLRIVDTLC